MSAYVRVNVEFPDEKDARVKKNELSQLTYLVSNVLHRDIESEISIREGSVIAEIISSGNLATLLSVENIKAIGVSVLESDVAKGILSYAVLRAAVNTLTKDIKTATATLSMVIRSVFGARLGDVTHLEARTGVIGSLQRFLEACDVARNEMLIPLKRLNALKRARDQLVSIQDVIESKDDMNIAGKYISRELKRIAPIADAQEYDDPKDAENAQAFNDLLKQCKALLAEIYPARPAAKKAAKKAAKAKKK